jgi:hypothetical protein
VKIGPTRCARRSALSQIPNSKRKKIMTKEKGTLCLKFEAKQVNATWKNKDKINTPK